MLVFTVPVNLHGWQPNVSVHSVSGERLAAWQSAYDKGCRHLLLGEAASAVDALREASDIDPGHAETWFRLGRALEANGDRDGARAAYLLAKDLDQNPFRAMSLLNESVRTTAASHPAVRLVDMEQLVMEATPLPAPGFDLFLDYVHPTSTGNRVIAKHTFDAILATDPFRLEPATRTFDVPDDGYRDEADFGVQLHVLTLTFFMHQYAAFVERANHVMSMLEASPDGAPLIELIRRGRDGVQHYLDMRRNELLGEPFEPDYREEHKRFYREFFAEIVKMR
jgi:tetratricopeptide (TPR) repeat protein